MRRCQARNGGPNWIAANLLNRFSSVKTHNGNQIRAQYLRQSDPAILSHLRYVGCEAESVELWPKLHLDRQSPNVVTWSAGGGMALWAFVALGLPVIGIMAWFSMKFLTALSAGLKREQQMARRTGELPQERAAAAPEKPKAMAAAAGK